jgi:hypothetical protein
MPDEMKEIEKEAVALDKRFKQLQKDAVEALKPEKPEDYKELLKENKKDNFFIKLLGVAVVIVLCVFLIGMFKGQVNDATLACSQPLCDLNSTQQLIAYGMIQDTNQHQILLNVIQQEQQCSSFMSKCRAVSQDFNSNTQLIQCQINMQ